jgi:hypothetical protein
MNNVVILPVVTRLDLPAQRTLDAACDANLETAVVIGWDADGDFYFASNKADGGDVLWLLELAKRKLFEAGQ